MFLNELKNGSLKNKLIQRILAVSLLVIIFLIIIDAYFAIKQEQEKLEQQFFHLEETMLSNLTNSLWTLNIPLAQTQIDGIKALDYIAYVEVLDEEKIFVSTDSTPPSHKNIVKKTYDLNYQVQNEMVKIGHVNILADTSGIYMNAIKEGIIIFLINTFIVLLLMYFTLAFLNKNVFIHLEKMSDFMRNVNSKDVYEKFSLNRSNQSPQKQDELDHLVNAFNFQREELTKKNNELLRSKDLFYKVFQSSPDAILISHFENGRIIEVNESFYRLYEFNKNDQVIGKTALELNIWSDTENREYWKKYLEEKGAIYLHESQYRKKSGKTSDAIISAQMINFGEFFGVVTTVRDISETKRYQEEILHSQKRLHNLAKNLENAIEKERIGISREIHDEFGQSLTGLKIDLTWLKDKQDSTNQEVGQRISRMIDNIDTTVDTVRRISSQLRPAILDDLGLEAAIEWVTKDFSERTNINFALNIDCDELDLSTDRDTAIFRIYQEALTNIARHSEADYFAVDMISDLESIQLKVVDNGKGITREQIHSDSSIGIIGMQERAANIGASIELQNIKTGGTQLVLRSPIQHVRVLN